MGNAASAIIVSPLKLRRRTLLHIFSLAIPAALAGCSLGEVRGSSSRAPAETAIPALPVVAPPAMETMEPPAPPETAPPPVPRREHARGHGRGGGGKYSAPVGHLGDPFAAQGVSPHGSESTMT